MKRHSWKYIAGLVDGEGCIDIQTSKGNYITPRLRIGMSIGAEELLKQFQANFKGSLCYRQSKNPNWQDSVCWELVGYTRVCMVLRNLVNHLVLKQEQAKFILMCEQHLKGKHLSKEIRMSCIDELKAMKRDPHRLSETAQERIITSLL